MRSSNREECRECYFGQRSTSDLKNHDIVERERPALQIDSGEMNIKSGPTCLKSFRGYRPRNILRIEAVRDATSRRTRPGASPCSAVL